MSDEALEKAIDEVGRDRVLARARSYGWTDYAPRWVWRGIVQELREGKPPPLNAATTSVLGFDLFGL